MILGLLGVYLLLTLCFGFQNYDTTLYEGAKCKNNNNTDGICMQQPDCHKAVEEVKLNGYHNLARCSFNGSVEIVCCPSLTDKVKIRKSIQVCKDYEKRLQQFISNESIDNNVTISLHSPDDPVYTIVAYGKDVGTAEYPHVVALGFYNTENQVYTFDCGGTLISNKYVITAAHCIANIDRNDLKVIRMGTIVVPSEPVTELDPDLDYKTKRVIVHPKYNRARGFHDIALVELEKVVVFQSSVHPACLYTKEKEPSKMQIAGWGAVNISGARSDFLQKADVSFFPLELCVGRFRNSRRSIGNTQICAQDVKSDTCAGDSGGPLQIQNNRTFTLVGVTSFGLPCFGGLPGIYTKVFSYLDWIEDIVWP